MKRKSLSTDAKRKAIAKAVSAIATDALGIPVKLERGGEWFPDDYKFSAEYLETERGRFGICGSMLTPWESTFTRALSFPNSHRLVPILSPVNGIITSGPAKTTQPQIT